MLTHGRVAADGSPLALKELWGEGYTLSVLCDDAHPPPDAGLPSYAGSLGSAHRVGAWGSAGATWTRGAAAVAEGKEQDDSADAKSALLGQPVVGTEASSAAATPAAKRQPRRDEARAGPPPLAAPRHAALPLFPERVPSEAAPDGAADGTGGAAPRPTPPWRQRAPASLSPEGHVRQRGGSSPSHLAGSPLGRGQRVQERGGAAQGAAASSAAGVRRASDGAPPLSDAGASAAEAPWAGALSPQVAPPQEAASGELPLRRQSDGAWPPVSQAAETRAVADLPGRPRGVAGVPRLHLPRAGSNYVRLSTSGASRSVPALPFARAKAVRPALSQTLQWARASNVRMTGAGAAAPARRAVTARLTAHTLVALRHRVFRHAHPRLLRPGRLCRPLAPARRL